MTFERFRRAVRSAGTLVFPAPHRRRRTLLLWSGVLLAGFSAATAQNSARAAALTYGWESGSSFSFKDGVSASPTGTFTIDTTQFTLKGSEIILTGSGPEAGTYGPNYYESGGFIIYTDGPADLTLSFDDLDSGPTQSKLDSVDWTQGDSEMMASKVSGGVQITGGGFSSTPVPEPSTWAMLLLGFGLVAGLRRKRGWLPVLIALTPFAASAATITQDFQIAVPAGSGDDETVDSSLVNTFNPALGTLTEIASSVEGSLTWVPGQGNTTLTMQLGGLGGSQSIYGPSTSPVSINVDFGGAITDSTKFNPWIGAGTKTIIDFVPLATPQTFGSFDSSVLSGELTYFYTPNGGGGGLGASPVPEPSTWAMMTLGFAGLGFVSYRARRAHVTA